jgi:predicted fused transcriptional regulator/phosphomethylpyrimidine kinase/predicted transcriptional regulator
MRPPCENVQKEFLPAVRTQLAQSLRQIGLSQMEIASRLDVTQAAVSKYLSQPIQQSELNDEILVLVARLTEMIQIPETKADTLVKELCSTCMSSRLGSILCRLHQKSIPSLKALNCQICSELLGGSDDGLATRAKVIGDMQEALQNIATSITFERIVPQVRANLVACIPNASSLEDVAGVPGRITIIGGHAVAPVGPQFGTSHHTAELLLKARSLWPNIRACLCVSGEDSVVKSAIENGIKVASIKVSASEAVKIFDGLLLVKKRPGKTVRFPAIHVPGGFGVEPILYLFGPTASELSEQCVNISESISS